MKNTQAPARNTSKEASKNTSNYIGTGIIAISALIGTTYGAKLNGRAIGCITALENAGILRKSSDRIETGLALTKEGFKNFRDLAETQNIKDAAKVLELAKELRTRSREIAAFKKGVENQENLVVNEATTNLVDPEGDIENIEIFESSDTCGIPSELAFA